MTEDTLSALTLVATVGAGLMAGLFFVFSVAIMPAFARIAPTSGMAAMQSINQSILNPWFLAVFFGMALICLVLSGVAITGHYGEGKGYVLAAGILYLIGCIGVTIGRNVPLNNDLAAVTPADIEGAKRWQRYVHVWTRWNHVRTVSCTASAALFAQALVVR